MRNVLIFGGLALTLGVANYAIVQKEGLRTSGTQMLVELAPVDPRSLMQGDYMRLNYAMSRDVAAAAGTLTSGRAVVTLDSMGVARFVAIYREGMALGAGERLLRFRQRDGRIRIGSNAFFFQEGSSGRYQSAKYGELRVDASGESILVGLRDANRKPL